MSDVAVIVMYFVGIAMGVVLTLWWQLFGAQIRRQLWDNYAAVWDNLNRSE